MEENVVVIMERNKETGFLEKELGSFVLRKNEELLYNIYGEEEQGGMKLVLRLSCDRELEDWEYNAVFDYYDTEALSSFAESIEEEDGHYSPVWRMVFPFYDSFEKTEKIISDILEAHEKELLSVYEAIADKKDDYIEE